MKDLPFPDFRREHVQVRRRVGAMRDAVASRRRGRVTRPALDRIRRESDALARQFATHMRAEEQVLYPALAPELPDGVARLAALRDEHRDLRAMLQRLRQLLDMKATAARDEQIVIQVGDLAELLVLHIDKEEAAVFGLAARVLEPRELARVAARVAARRDELERRLSTRSSGKGAGS